MTGEESAGTSDFSWKCVFNIEGKKLRSPGSGKMSWRFSTTCMNDHFYFLNPFYKHLNPIKLVFLGYPLLSSTLRFVPVCQGFSHFSAFLHHFVLAKFATTSIRVDMNTSSYLPKKMVSRNAVITDPRHPKKLKVIFNFKFLSRLYFLISWNAV